MSTEIQEVVSKTEECPWGSLTGAGVESELDRSEKSAQKRRLMKDTPNVHWKRDLPQSERTGLENKRHVWEMSSSSRRSVEQGLLGEQIASRY